MKSLNRTLSLVLVLVMVFGLFGVASASSSTYTDSTSVGTAYAEAVDLLTGIGVVNGTTSTTLEPTGNYTREQAAKVICYLTLGKSTADALACSTAPFTDVAASRWSAGFVQYCVSQGIINGMGDGTFAPEANLTGYQFAKMLLGALGYGKSGEFVGSGWEIAVAKEALGLKIFKGDTLAATNNYITRQQAMLMAANTLFLATVKAKYAYDNGVKYVSEYTTGGASFAATIYGYDSTKTAASDAASALVKVTTTVNGSVGYKWYYKSTSTAVTGFYTAQTVIGSGTIGTSIATMSTYSTTNSYYVADLATAATFYLNGAQITTGVAATGTFVTGTTYYTTAACTTTVDTSAFVAGTTSVASYYVYSTAASLATAEAAIGKGVKVDFVDTNDDTDTAEKVFVTTYRVDVVAAAPVLTTNTADGKSYLFLDLTTTDIGTSGGYTVKASNVTGYTGLVKGDVVLVYATNAGTYNIVKATTFTGSATAASGTSLTIGGTVYKAAANAHASITTYAQGFLNSVAFYTDSYGYLVYAKAVTAVSTDYLYVLESAGYTDTITATGTNKSAVVFKDGSTATITVSSLDGKDYATYGVAIKPAAADAYSYIKNTDGTYALISATEVRSSVGSETADADGAFTQGATVVAGTAPLKTDSTTVYVARNIKTAGAYSIDIAAGAHSATGTTYYTTWTAYTGFANMITASAAQYIAVNGTDGFADIVFVTNYKTTATQTSNVIYLLSNVATAVYKSATVVDYYTFPAIVDGVKTVVKSTSDDATLYNATTNTDGLAYAATGTALASGMLCSVTYSNGYITPGTVVPVTAATFAGVNTLKAATIFNVGTGVTAPENGVITIGTTGYFGYSATTVVFYISADKTTVTVGTAANLSASASATVTGVTEAAGITSPTTLQQNTLKAIFVQANS